MVKEAVEAEDESFSLVLVSKVFEVPFTDGNRVNTKDEPLDIRNLQWYDGLLKPASKKNEFYRRFTPRDDIVPWVSNGSEIDRTESIGISAPLKS